MVSIVLLWEEWDTSGRAGAEQVRVLTVTALLRDFPLTDKTCNRFRANPSSERHVLNFGAWLCKKFPPLLLNLLLHCLAWMEVKAYRRNRSHGERKTIRESRETLTFPLAKKTAIPELERKWTRIFTFECVSVLQGPRGTLPTCSDYSSFPFKENK